MKEYHIDNKFKSSWKKKILSWYLVNKRNLPWRNQENQNFYRIWISEVMLQQTKVTTVIPFFKKFIKKWPTLDDFFNAKLEEILKLWEGLGYYKRAQNLFRAKELLRKKKINISSESLKELPGIGDYISCSIAAILKDESCAVIDGNIRRILSRVFDLNINNKKFNSQIKEISTQLTPKNNNGNYCQSLMDLANLICLPKNPKCIICPISFLCKSKGKEIKIKKKQQIPTKLTVAFVVRFNNYFLVEKTKENLLQNLFTFPLSEFRNVEEKDSKDFLIKSVSSWMNQYDIETTHEYVGEVTHKFSHFHLKVLIVKIILPCKLYFNNFEWLTLKKLNQKPISSMMVKIKNKVK